MVWRVVFAVANCLGQSPGAESWWAVWYRICHGRATSDHAASSRPSQSFPVSGWRCGPGCFASRSDVSSCSECSTGVLPGHWFHDAWSSLVVSC